MFLVFKISYMKSNIYRGELIQRSDRQHKETTGNKHRNTSKVYLELVTLK